MKTPDRKLDEIIIHIGTEKTGTTAIQDFLRKNRVALAKRGVLYPRSLGHQFGSQVELLGVAHEAPWEHDFGTALGIENKSDQKRFEAELNETLCDELKRHRRVSRMLISSEHLHSRVLSVARIQYLKDFLQPFTRSFRIVVWFRRQDEVGFSFQSTRLKSLVDVGDLDLRLLLVAPPGYYDYAKLYESWASVFGAEAMSPTLFHEAVQSPGGLMTRFLDMCHIPSTGLDTDVGRINRSLDVKGFHFLRALNQLHPMSPGDRSDQARIALNKEVERLFSGSYRPIDRQQIIEWYKPYARVNERLRKIAFPERTNELFDSRFSEYPDHGEPTQLNFEDAVLVAYELWKANYRAGPEKSPAWRRMLHRLKTMIKRRIG